MTAHHEEVERSYDVPDGTVLPSLSEDDGMSMGQPTELALEALYFDTTDLALAGHGATLRRRTGGDDAGWHLKLRRTGDTRVELRCPLGDDGDTPPAEVLAPVRAWVRDRAVSPLAVISTRRLQRTLADAGGATVATICDDEVRAQRLVGARREMTWREWEVELVNPAEGSEDLLDRVESTLVEAGAARSAAPSKLARVVGDLLPSGAPSDPDRLRGDAAIEDLLAVELRALRDRVHRHDVRLRAGADDAVHRMRIAARRTRSALRTFKPLLDADRAERLGSELRWLGQELAGARDAQVLRAALLDQVEQQPAELVLGAVATRIDDELRAAESAGRERAIRALEDERYFRLLDELDRFVSAPPVVSKAGRSAADVLPRLLQRDMRRLRHAVRDVHEAGSGDERDEALHEARKKAKRLRYAAELAVPALGKGARRLGRRAKRVQQALGDHQDSVVARERLRELGVQAYLAGDNGFTYGRLHALQEQRAADAARDFEAAWDQMPTKDLRRWP
jgi:CHAD domain-containing protein